VGGGRGGCFAGAALAVFAVVNLPFCVDDWVPVVAMALAVRWRSHNGDGGQGRWDGDGSG